MKSLSVLFAAIALFATTAKADVTCVENAANPNQGYAAIISENQASVLLNGQVVATLALDHVIQSQGNDMPTTRRYQQNAVNGYVIDLSSGGFTGQTGATILRGGVYGYDQVASIYNCR